MAAVVSQWLAQIARRPVDLVAISAAIAASVVVVVNAIFLQSGPHPAPFVTNSAAPKITETAPPQPPISQRPMQTVAGRRGDPIADLIGSSARVAAVQRVLAQFGYGQIKPTGTLDEPTSAAIEKFEGEHKMPVTGRLSDRLLAELAAMTGRSIE